MMSLELTAQARLDANRSGSLAPEQETVVMGIQSNAPESRRHYSSTDGMLHILVKVQTSTENLPAGQEP